MMALLLLGKIKRYGDEAAEDRCLDSFTMQRSVLGFAERA
jgi:hypothetical protein